MGRPDWRAGRWAACLAALCMTGCASVSDESLRSQVSVLIAGDRFADMAMTHLEKAGFTCVIESGNDVECSRKRSPNPLTTCIQRVILVDARVKNEFSGVRTQPPACFSGFG